jgi:phosphatidylserine/phosphatidylglycerophosphate/cardiolipin synthase-like enzyme
MSRSFRRNSSSVGTITVVLILLGIVYSCQQAGGVDLGLGATPTAAPPPLPTAIVDNPPSATWYTLYFTTPELTAGIDAPAGGIPAKVVETLDAAQKTIDLATYEFDLTMISDALIRAAQRGVRVRVVTDTDTLLQKPVTDLIGAGVPVVDDQRDPIMHDKFVIVDGATLWVGSMNFTFSDAYRNDNNFIEITSPRLAENYTTEFEEMFINHEFGPTSTANTPHPTLTLNGTLVENYFSPDDGVAAHLLSLLNAAQSSIYFMAFTFTRADFQEALIARAKAGVTVQGVFETRQISAGSDNVWNALSAAGLPVRQDGNRYTMHNKVFIIDGQIVVTGSYNFSKAAEAANDENVLVFHDPTFAAAYFAEWQKVWDAAKP